MPTSADLPSPAASAAAPDCAELAHLAEKYALLADLRRRKVADGYVPERKIFRALAARYPGVLHELETLPLGVIDERARLLRQAAAGGAVEPWMSWVHAYHALLRAGLWVKRHRGRGTDAALALGASRHARFEVSAEFACLCARPPDGRLVPVVLRCLCELYAQPVDVLAATLRPSLHGR